MKEALLRGERLGLRVVRGQQAAGLAPLMTVSVDDDSQEGVVLVGVDGDDLVLRYRTRSASLRLAVPEMRAGDMLRGRGPGDTLVVAVWRHNGTHCVEVDAERRCGVGLGVARGWSVVGVPAGIPSRLLRWIDVLWIAVLFVPLGYWIRLASRGVLAILPATAGLAVASALPGLVRPSIDQIAAIVVALVIGTRIAPALASRIRHRDRPALRVSGRAGLPGATE
jgi:hypothetical protein